MRDFADLSFHAYFSMMEGLLESTGEPAIELKWVAYVSVKLLNFLAIIQ